MRRPAPAQGSARRISRARTMAAVIAGLLAFTAAPPAGLAADAADSDAVPAREPAWLSFGLLSGSTLLDAHLADYQWDTRPRMDWGGAVRVGRGRLSTGLRLWRAATTQLIDLPSGPVSPAVRQTSLELTGRVRVASPWRTAWMACASAGRLHLGYAPDRIVVVPSGSGGPVTADLRPVDEWIGGIGLACQLPMPARWLADVELDRQVYRLDTAHRSGGVIVNQRESFGDWSVRLELARLFPLTVKGTSR